MIEIILGKESYAAGEQVDATVRISLEKPVKARGVYLRLACHEKKIVKRTVVLDKYEYERDKEMGNPYVSHMETTNERRDSTRYSKEIQLAGEGTFSSSEFQAKISLPPDAPPTSHEFGHDNMIHIWKLHAKLDIPFALDMNSEKEVFVSGL